MRLIDIRNRWIVVDTRNFSREEIQFLNQLSWRTENREKGDRLESITRNTLERIKKRGIVKDFKHFRDEAKPDFVVDKDIGIECKNRDPKKKNIFNKHNVEKQITSKFKGQKWRKKVLIITKLMLYPRDEKECRKLLRDYIIVEIGSFVTEENLTEMGERLFVKLMKKKSEIFN